MSYLIWPSIVAAALLVPATPALAQSPAEVINPAAFVKKASLMSMVELELGKIAETRASSPEVKAFAHQVVTDHTAAQDELIKAAKLTPAALPTELEPADAALKQQLLTRSGAAFDRAYIEHMTVGHEEAEAFLVTAAASQADPALKQWAAQTLPLVQAHRRESGRLKTLMTSKDAPR
jgi:putative membrane protein